MSLWKRKDTLTIRKHLQKIAEALKVEDDEHITYINNFLSVYPPSTSSEVMSNFVNDFKNWSVLELVLEKMLPATFANTFLSFVYMLVQIDEFDLEIYSLDGTSKILYAMKENGEDAEIQILGMISQLHYSPMKTEAIREVIIESEKEIIHYLCNILLRQGIANKKLCYQALNPLINFSFENNSAKDLIIKSYLPKIVELAFIHVDNATLTHHFFALFRNLANSRRLKAKVYSLDFESIITASFDDAIRGTNYPFLINLIWFLINMNCGSHEYKSISIDFGLVGSLVHIIDSPKPTELSQAILILFLQVAKLSRGREILAEADVCLKLFNVLKSSKDSNLIELSCRLLERLCLNKKARNDMMFKYESNIIHLLEIMQSHKDDLAIHQHIVKFFCRIVKDRDVSVHISKVLKENQGISTLVTSMNTYPQAKHLKVRICSILNSLFSDDANTDESITSSEEGSEDSDKNYDDEDLVKTVLGTTGKKYDYDDASSSHSFEDFGLIDNELEEFEENNVSLEDLLNVDLEETQDNKEIDNNRAPSQNNLKPLSDRWPFVHAEESVLLRNIEDNIEQPLENFEKEDIKKAFTFWMNKDAELRATLRPNN